MDQANLQLWITVQIVIEGVLIVFMTVFFLRLRRMKGSMTRTPEQLDSSISQFITESEKLSERFTENLKEKKELSLALLLKLERKINEMNQLIQTAEERTSQVDLARPESIMADKDNPASPKSRALVLKLATKGHSIEEIAREARLNRGEVELILDLDKQFSI
ncbi:MAG: hypothetical protein JRD68_06905 [Deltaproteobacteria bacterium]|nr:hypothetical protein [Deltaproteobacteria bacterium]